MKFYLSHPRSGGKMNPIEDMDHYIKENLERADWIAQQLEGLELVQPFKLIEQDGSVPEVEAMKMCIKLLLECDGIILCPNWENSPGCVLERDIASATGKVVFELDEC